MISSVAVILLCGPLVLIKMEPQLRLPTLAVLIFTQMSLVYGHGRLMDPPARNSMWRFGFNTPVDYHDNEINCGGPQVQYGKNGGKCGVCGDDYADTKGPHKAGGRYARGIIGRQYKMGQEIQVEVEITANHWGRFEMYVCPTNDPKVEATETCFQKFPLYLAGMKDEVKFGIPKNYKKWGLFQYNVRLPPSLTCSQCVLQWTYYTGYVYGKCADNDTVSLGCGGVRTFRNCADIAIVAGSQGGNYLKPKPSGGAPMIESPTFTYLGEGNQGIPSFNSTSAPDSLGSEGPDGTPQSSTTETQHSENTVQNEEDSFEYNKPPEVLPIPVRSTVCIATPLFKKLSGADEWCQQNCLSVPPKCPEKMCTCPNPLKGADEWCQQNCLSVPPKCPEKMCTCPDTCDAVGSMEGKPGAETWCQGLCIVYPYKCHEEQENRCRCYKAVHEESVFTNFFPFEESKQSLGYWE